MSLSAACFSRGRIPCGDAVSAAVGCRGSTPAVRPIARTLGRALATAHAPACCTFSQKQSNGIFVVDRPGAFVPAVSGRTFTNVRRGQLQYLSSAPQERPATRIRDTIAADTRRIVAACAAMEAQLHPVLPAGAPWAVRLDGVAFKTYTARLSKPFDARLTAAVARTARDLLARFPLATAAYAQSDEVSLFFPATPSPADMPYAGRLQKIVSVMASLASAHFNHHMRLAMAESSVRTGDGQAQTDGSAASRTEDASSQHEPSDLAVFDARAFSTHSALGTADALLWRHALDGRRNAVSMVAATRLTHAQMQGVSLAALTALLAGPPHGVEPYRDYPPAAMRGALLKRGLVPHAGVNPATGLAVQTTRARVQARVLDLLEVPDRAALGRLVLAPHWTDADPPSLDASALF